MNKHLIWAITVFSIIAMICGTLIFINYNSWTVRFEMDNNTKEAVESIDYSIMQDNKIECYSEICYLDLEENQIGGCNMGRIDCSVIGSKYGFAFGSETE